MPVLSRFKDTDPLLSTQSVAKAYDASKVKNGRFGAMMACSLTNDGPVTLQVDSRKYTYDTPAAEQKGKAKSSPASSAPASKVSTPALSAPTTD